jgi:hypothetical protein
VCAASGFSRKIRACVASSFSWKIWWLSSA